MSEEEIKNKIDDEEEEQEKELTAVERFMLLFNKLGDLFVLNVYFTVTCLPIVTIGASFTALYTVTNKMVKNEEGAITKEYFKAWKANLKQGIAIWLIDLIYIAIMVFEYGYVLGHDDQISKVLFILVGAGFFLFALAFPLQFPILARYENTIGRIIFNSLVLAFTYPGTWFKMFFIWALPFVLYYINLKVRVYTWYLWGLILTAIFAYICSMFLLGFYEKLESEPTGE